MVVDESIALENPFPGLRPFDEEEEHLFFGREGQSDELVMRLAKTKFLAVVGSSGSGKSSLVRCGLLPSLYGGYMASAGSAWRVAIFRPADDPIGNLAAALAQPEVLGGDDAPMGMYQNIIESTLRRSQKGVVDAFQQKRLPDYENLLIIADQFEELFRFSSIEKKGDQTTSDATNFVNLLLAAAAEKAANVYVVLTMRSDFLGHCTEFRGLPEAINDGQYLIPRMTREERRAAITGPVAVGGADIAPRLITRLLNDVGDNPDQLPILQHALMRTWEYWAQHHIEEEPLDLVHYNAIGTLSGALSQHAEEAYDEIKDPSKKQHTQVIFKALTDKSSHTSGIRRPTRLDEIMLLTGASKETVIAILDVFRKPGRSFIMPPAQVPLQEDTVIDISHESFMRVWDRLVQWVDEEAQAAETYSRLAEAARLYQLGESGIWRDPELSIALRWQKENNPNRTWAHRYNPTFERAIAFLDYSQEQAHYEIELKEKQQRQRMRRARIFAIVLGLASLLTLSAAIWAYTSMKTADKNAAEARIQRKNAEEQKNKAEEATVMAIEEQHKAEKERERAEIEKQKAEEQEQKAQEQKRIAERNKQRAEAQTAIALAEKARAEEQEQIAKDNKEEADQQREKAVLSQQEALRRKELAEARNLAFDAKKALSDNNLSDARAKALEAYHKNKDNNGPSQNNDIYQALEGVYQAEKGIELVYFNHKEPVKSITAHPSSAQWATGDDGGSVHLVSVKDDQLSGKPLANLRSSIRCMSFSSDGKKIYAATFDQKFYVIDAGSGNILDQCLVETTPLLLYCLPGSDNILLVGNNTLMSLKPQGNKISIAHQEKYAGITAAKAEGDRLVIAQKSVLTLFKLSSSGSSPWSQANSTDIKGAQISSLEMLLSEDAIVLGTNVGRIYHCNLSLQNLQGPYPEHKSGITSFQLQNIESKPTLVSSSLDNTSIVFPLNHFSNEKMEENEDDRIELLGHDKWVLGAQFTRDGRHVLTISQDKRVRLWFTHMDDLAAEVEKLSN